MRSRGFEVSICSNGRPLEEYDVCEYDEDGEPTLECFIASEAGKKFTIRWCEAIPATDLRVDCYLDGQLVDETAHCADVGHDELQGVTISQEEYRPFVFAEVETTENRKIAAPGAVDDFFGTIVVMLTKVDYWRPASKHKKFSLLEVVENTRPVHVKDVVEGGHHVRFGQPTQVSRLNISHRTSYSVQDPVDIDDVPFLCFCFNYMPKEALRAKGVILAHSSAAFHTQPGHGRSPSPSRLTRPSRPSKRRRTEDVNVRHTVVEMSSDSDDDTRVPSPPVRKPASKAIAQALVEAEVRDIQAQMDALRQRLETKKRLLANTKSVDREHKPVPVAYGKTRAICPT